MDLDELDIVLVLTTTWFKEKHCDFGKMISKDLDKKVIFIRTKLDDSITNDRNRIEIGRFSVKFFRFENELFQNRLFMIQKWPVSKKNSFFCHRE